MINYFFNSLEYTSYSGNILIEISDHLIQFLILEGYIPGINIVKRDYRNFNENEVQEAIYDWVSIVDIKSKDPNNSINNFMNSATSMLGEFAPNTKSYQKGI